MTQSSPRISSVKRFYFLEYFYVLLKSVERHSDVVQVFGSFRELKHKHRLGESKYKIKLDSDDLSPGQLNRYIYTFQEVIDEAEEYSLIAVENAGEKLRLKRQGRLLLSLYDAHDPTQFNQFLFRCMEKNYNAFRFMVELLYANNNKNPGLLIFPMYSPRQLGIERSELTTSAHIMKYSESLIDQLERDIIRYLGLSRKLSKRNSQLLDRLREIGFLPTSSTERFDPRRYNAILKRFRDHWVTYFLNEIYGYKYSLSSFERWLYRGKQIGIVHASDIYPGFDGRIVYPTSVLMGSTESPDFQHLYTYGDRQHLFIHRPDWAANQDKFVDSLVDAYYSLRRTNRSYFINLLSMRELVCYNLKISELTFEQFLENAYRLNLSGELRIRISLEVDRLPEETTAMYLKREPVMVDGRYRNIIAIDVAKGAR